MRGARPDRALDRHVAVALATLPPCRMAVALSGGSDSVALAWLAYRYTHQRNGEITLIHINHGRRASADQDEAVAVAVAARLGLPLYTRRLTISRDDEASLREARYAAICEVMSRIRTPYLMTGHTASDQTETLLLALFRGSGRRGLAGIPRQRALTPDCTVVRPLLRLDRETLRRCCERAHLPYVIDPTNTDRRYRRNLVREALDTLRLEFPGLDRAVARTIALLAQEHDEPEAATASAAIAAWLRARGGEGGDISSERIERILATFSRIL